ncbi:uncharacterized protein LOC143180188 [Calliopsis andreniformis]|uniref:uncharacterized protein LOC143180188 n=1 Tax=Calliopsis andreniformis TaxID=337506 RepID=UPI003FCDE90B
MLENRWAIVRFEILEISLLVNSLHAFLRGHDKMEQEAKYLAMDSRVAKIRSMSNSHGSSGSKMKKSPISLLVSSLLLLCFVNPLWSDPQQGYWTNYVAYNPPEPQFQSVDVFPDQYSVPSIQRPPTYVAPYETKPFSSYESQYLQNQPIRYPARVPEAKFFHGKGYYDYSDFAPSIHEGGSLKKNWVNFEQTKERRNDQNEQEIIQRMSVLDKMLSEDSNKKGLHKNRAEDSIMSEEMKRVVRQVRKQRPGFFWTLARITFEAFNDTRAAIQQIGNLINNNIVPDSATDSSRTSSLTAVGANTTVKNMTVVNETESTTTQAPFVLTRSRVQSLIRRNILGLVRLFNIEWRDALNQSEVNVREFQQNLGNQVGTYLRDNPNAF